MSKAVANAALALISLALIRPPARAFDFSPDWRPAGKAESRPAVTEVVSPQAMSCIALVEAFDQLNGKARKLFDGKPVVAGGSIDPLLLCLKKETFDAKGQLVAIEASPVGSLRSST